MTTRPSPFVGIWLESLQTDMFVEYRGKSTTYGSGPEFMHMGAGVDETGVFQGRYEDWLWMVIDASHLGGGTLYADGSTANGLTPSQLIQMQFGNSLSSPNDSFSSLTYEGWDGHYRPSTRKFYAMTAPPDSDGLHYRDLFADPTDSLAHLKETHQDIMHKLHRANTVSSYMIGAHMISLPPLVQYEDLPSQLEYFFDITKTWGFAYEADVFYAGSPHATVGMFYDREADDLLGTDRDAITSALAATIGDWTHVPDAEYEGIPGGDSAGSWNIFPLTIGSPIEAPTQEFLRSAGGKGYQWAAGYSLEAVGFDYFDSYNVRSTGPSPLLWDIEDIDANEFLHSNEVFRTIPAMSDAEKAIAISPAIVTQGETTDGAALGYSILWSYDPAVCQYLAGRYHAKESTTDSFTRLPPPENTNVEGPFATVAQEMTDLNETIKTACDAIALDLQTVTFPKKYINHLQRRKKIPNNLVSAFGYVPEEMYTVGDPDSLDPWLDITATTYDHVTGEVMSGTATWGALTSEEMAALGHEGGWGERGEESSDWSAGEGWISPAVVVFGD